MLTLNFSHYQESESEFDEGVLACAGVEVGVFFYFIFLFFY